MKKLGFVDGLGSWVNWFVFCVLVKVVAPLFTTRSVSFVQSGATDWMCGKRA
jgi:hypothetical protein